MCSRVSNVIYIVRVHIYNTQNTKTLLEMSGYKKKKKQLFGEFINVYFYKTVSTLKRVWFFENFFIFWLQNSIFLVKYS